MVPKRMRRFNPNSSIKRLKWLTLGLLVIGAFGIVVFLNFRALSKDVSFSHDYYAAIELDALAIGDSLWAFDVETFNPAYSAAYEQFRAANTGSFFDNIDRFLTEISINQMTFQTLQAPETVVFELSKTGSNELTAVAEKTVTGFLLQSLEDAIISPDGAKNILEQQVVYFVTVRTIGRRDVGQEFLYSNGRYDSHPDDGLQWVSGNQFRFTHYLDVAQLTSVPNTAEQLKNALSELAKRRSVAGEDHRQQYLALVGFKEREVAKLPVIGVEVPIPEALASAAILATIYINLVLATMNPLGIRQVLRSDEPWFLLDIAELSTAAWPDTYRILSFYMVTLGHALIYLIPVLLTVLAWNFVSGPLVYVVAILGFFSTFGTLLTLLSFLRLFCIVSLIRKRRRLGTTSSRSHETALSSSQ